MFIKKATFGACILTVVLTAGAVHAQPPALASADRREVRTTADHWAYAELDQVQHPGRLSVNYYHKASPRLTRGDFARIIARKWTEVQPRVQTGGALDREVRDGLSRLAAEFAPELRQIGTDSEALRKVLDAARISEPFRDVPPTHWAYYGVERLRKTGIVVGYPSGGFGVSDGTGATPRKKRRGEKR